jgi:hypothetical protein
MGGAFNQNLTGHCQKILLHPFSGVASYATVMYRICGNSLNKIFTKPRYLGNAETLYFHQSGKGHHILIDKSNKFHQ